ncbi:DNA damage-inducible transcript 3 protein isoform X2 [Stegostoma tigrinum]|nr:DNA damage-inducible transcript 3 protein isoform X2 [Stegostoma tigrinum]XP_059499901.1 DNA damage-inducible transcript 3 protein isoform X2 [Stegostoma tigrinum]
MSDWSTFGPFPAAPVPLSGQDLEAWLEDLESVLYPSPAADRPGRVEEESRKLKELWVDDVDSVLCPPDPADDPQRLNQLLLEDLESILYPALVSEDHTTSLGIAEPEASPPRPGERPPLSSHAQGRREDEPLLADEPWRCSDLPSSSSSSSSSPSPSSQPGRERPGEGARGTKRRRREGGRCPSCSKTSPGAAQLLVESLTQENERLRHRIEELAREVQEARARLIQKVVDAR